MIWVKALAIDILSIFLKTFLKILVVWYHKRMISKMFLGSLIGITAVLVILVMTNTLVMADSPTDSDGESQESGEIGHHFYTSESGEKEKCEGMVYETAEAAEAAAIKNGCSGYHKFDKDGTVWYMPDC